MRTAESPVSIGEAVISEGVFMKKLLLLLIVVALGAAVAKKVRNA
jgi:hypothetical protein